MPSSVFLITVNSSKGKQISWQVPVLASEATVSNCREFLRTRQHFQNGLLAFLQNSCNIQRHGHLWGLCPPSARAESRSNVSCVTGGVTSNEARNGTQKWRQTNLIVRRLNSQRLKKGKGAIAGQCAGKWGCTMRDPLRKADGDSNYQQSLQKHNLHGTLTALPWCPPTSLGW